MIQLPRGATPKSASRAGGDVFFRILNARDEVAKNTDLYDATNNLSSVRFVCPGVGHRESIYPVQIISHSTSLQFNHYVVVANRIDKFSCFSTATKRGKSNH